MDVIKNLLWRLKCWIADACVDCGLRDGLHEQGCPRQPPAPSLLDRFDRWA